MTLRQGRIIGTHGSDTAGGYGIADVDRPQPRQVLDLDAWAAYEAANTVARDAYYADQPQPCGTPAAYQRHARAGEQPCDPCADANRVASQERWRVNKESKK